MTAGKRGGDPLWGGWEGGKLKAGARGGGRRWRGGGGGGPPVAAPPPPAPPAIPPTAPPGPRADPADHPPSSGSRSFRPLLGDSPLHLPLTGHHPHPPH